MLDNARRFTQKIDAVIAGHSHELLNTTINGIPQTGAQTAWQAKKVIDLPLHGQAITQDVRLVFPD